MLSYDIYYYNLVVGKITYILLRKRSSSMQWLKAWYFELFQILSLLDFSGPSILQSPVQVILRFQYQCNAVYISVMLEGWQDFLLDGWIFIYVCLVNFALWLSSCFLLDMKLCWINWMALPFSFSFHCCHYVGRKTTPGIYSTNIFSALIILQKLWIRLLTKKLQFLTSQSLWSRVSQMVTHASTTHPTNYKGSYLQIKDFLLSSPKSIALLTVENVCQTEPLPLI